MPTQEPLVNTIIPQKAEVVIPTRTVITRATNIPKINSGQPVTNNSPAAESAKPEESVRLSPEISALARKEQAFRQREQALKQRELDIEAKLAKADRFEALEAKMSSKDFSEAEALGLNYEDYVKYQLDKQVESNPQDDKIRELEAKLEALQKGSEESAASQYEETIAEYNKEIVKAISEDPNFSSIKMLESINGVPGEKAVLQLILDSFEQDDVELTVQEACQQVEDYVYSFGKKFNELPKFKEQAVEVEAPKKALPRPIVGKTLTNDMTASSDKRPSKSLHQLSEAERYAEARRRVIERREKGK